MKKHLEGGSRELYDISAMANLRPDPAALLIIEKVNFGEVFFANLSVATHHIVLKSFYYPWYMDLNSCVFRDAVRVLMSSFFVQQAYLSKNFEDKD